MRNLQLMFEAIGTKWIIDCYSSGISEKQLLSLIKKRIEVYDKTYSRFRKDSLVWEISEKAGNYTFPKNAAKLFALYDRLYQITDGAFTLLIGNTLDEAGYDAQYSLKPRKINKVPDPTSIFSFDYPNLTVKKPYILDFGGLGKGYLIDILAEILIEKNVSSFCIEGGGDIRCHNLKEDLKVGLENPNDLKQVIGITDVNNKSICASSGNRRRWDKFHHIIDAKSLSSPNKILATWAVAEEALIADAMSTCLFLTAPEKLTKYFDFEYLILYPDFSIKKSENFHAEFFY